MADVGKELCVGVWRVGTNVNVSDRAQWKVCLGISWRAHARWACIGVTCLNEGKFVFCDPEGVSRRISWHWLWNGSLRSVIKTVD